MSKSLRSMIKELKEKALGYFCWDCTGSTVREVFEGFDSEPGCMVFWGCWTEAELDTVIK